MRLVSVVVPLWLIATARVSLMSRRSPNPESSVAVIGVDVEVAAAQLVEHGGHRLAGDRRGALADDAHAPDRSGGEPLGDARRQGTRRRRRRAADRPSSAAILPRSVLAKLSGDSVISLRRKCGELAPVDVAGRDLGDDDVGLGDRLLGAVVAEPADAGQLAGPVPVEHDDLPAVLTVEADVAVGLLHHAVRLAGDDEAVVGEADVDALAAAVEGEQQALRLVGGGHADGDRALERRHRAAERLDEVAADGLGVAGDEGRDHLGVGGDRAGEAQPVRDLQVGVVVDVAVEHGHDVRRRVAARLLHLLAVHRVGVGLGDDARRWPSGCGRAPTAWASDPARASRSRRSAVTARRRARVLSPSSPISAAAL